MDAAARAIAEPRRREILTLIARRELGAGEIASHFDVTRPAISQHLTVLKDAGLVYERREGTRRFYRARPQGLGELRSFLETFWDSRLGRLKLIAEAEERSARSHAISRRQSHRTRNNDKRKT
jgi:DNA-binding transcriptional ArsR family regulator